MDWYYRAVFLLCCWQLVSPTEPPCVIPLECAECVADHMPLVSSHRASAGVITAASGDELLLRCGAGRFLAYPLRAALAVRCEAGRYRVPADGALRRLPELGCQESVFEDVLHSVEHCAPPLQGRAYQLRDAAGVEHMATVCFDEDRGLPVFAHMSNAPANMLRLPPHGEQRSPLTLFGNLNHMFDANTRAAAEKLYSDDARTERRLRELFKHDEVSFAGQSVTGAGLLASHYFDDQNMRVADFVSNKVAAWRSVAAGNLRHLHEDVAKFMRMSRPHASVDVYAGTHGVMSLRTGGSREEVFLKVERFPVPRYVWTVVHDKRSGRALAVVVLNDPFVAVSEIREAVFCESACARAGWLHQLRRQRRYEAPLYGLAFCCHVHDFTAVVHEMPEAVLANVTQGPDGLLTDLYDQKGLQI